MYSAKGFKECLNFSKNACKQEMFQKHICPPWCKIQNYYLYVQGMGATPASSLVLINCRGQKILSGQHSGLTLTFKHVTWKSIRIIYLLGEHPALSLVLIKWRGQKILSGQHLVYRPTDIPTPSCKTICPLFQGGHKNYSSLMNSIHMKCFRICTM